MIVDTAFAFSRFTAKAEKVGIAGIDKKVQHRYLKISNRQMMNKMKKMFDIGVILLLVWALTGCDETEQAAIQESSIVSVEVLSENVRTQREVQESEETMECTIIESEVVGPMVENTEDTEAEQEAAEPEVYEFEVSDKEYFADALFIGDSRTVGLQLYGTLDNADYFATPGLNLFTIPKAEVEIGEYGEISLEELLDKKDYKKIYLMLGINELGYDFEATLKKYNELVEQLRTKEAEAVLYVCANLHVTSIRDENDEIHNNENINRINGEIARLADNKDIFYLDVNPLFDDENGNLNEEYASDDSHVLGEYYEIWCEWLMNYTIKK